MRSHTQALRIRLQSKDFTFNGVNPSCLTCISLSLTLMMSADPFYSPITYYEAFGQNPKSSLQTENKTETRVFGVMWLARPGQARVQSLQFFEWAAAVMVHCFPCVFSCSMHIQESSSSTPLPSLMHTKSSSTLITLSSDPNFNPPYSIALTSSLSSVQDTARAVRCSKSSPMA